MSSVTPKPTYSIDTVGLVLYLEKRRLGANAQAALQQAEAQQATIFIPAMVFAEILYLSEKKRIALTFKELFAFLDVQSSFVELPLDQCVIQAAYEIKDIPELHDRLIAASAKVKAHPLITNDVTIQNSTFVTTIW
ncbi:PIN domain-containing protein [Candidatus Leptofilum sp.]|uniref:PIN domain-containing protein n=1 Tax=Candidatus Leptofilum sp. TaxID=3241576 RepID=UPI003B5C734F